MQRNATTPAVLSEKRRVRGNAPYPRQVSTRSMAGAGAPIGVIDPLRLRPLYGLKIVVVLQPAAQLRHQARLAAGWHRVHGGEDLGFSTHKQPDSSGMLTAKTRSHEG